MPLRVGRQTCRLISQTLCTQHSSNLCLSILPPIRCKTSSSSAPKSKGRRNSVPYPPPPKVDPLRDRLKALLTEPTDERTIQKLTRFKQTLPANALHVVLLAEALVHHGYIPDALEVLSRARAQGVDIRTERYEPITYRLGVARRWHDILALLEPLQSLRAPRVTTWTGKLTTRLCEWRVRACAELGDFAGMQRALGMFPHGISRRAWEIAERACVRNSDVQTANKIREFLKIEDAARKEAGEEKEPEWKTIEELVWLLVWRPGARDRSGGSLGNLQAVQLSRKHDAPNPTYTAAAYTTLSPFQGPHITRSFKPNARLAALCVYDLVRSDQVKKAAIMVASMCKGIPVSDTFSPESSTSKPPLDPVNDTLSLPEVFASVRPDIMVFNALLRGVLNTRGLDGMLLLLEIMQEQAIASNAETGVLLLRYLDRQLAWRPFQLTEALIDLTKPIDTLPDGDNPIPPKPKPIPISIRHTNVLLSSILHTERKIATGGGWKAAAAFLKYRRRPMDRLPPTDARVDSSPNKVEPPTAGLRFRSRIADFERVLQALRARGVRNDPMSYALRAQRDGVIRLDPEAARDVLQSADFPLGEHHYAALMAGLTECGHMAAAGKVMRAAHDAGFGVREPVLHTILICGYGRMGMPEEAERAFHNMCRRQVAPDAIAVDALAGAWFIVGEYQRARQAILDHWPGRYGPPHSRSGTLKELAEELRKLRPTPKVRAKQDGDATQEELQQVGRIIKVLKVPDKILSPISMNESKK